MITLNLKTIIEKVNKLELSQDNMYQIVIVTNITLNPYLIPFLKLNFSKSNIFTNVQILHFDNYINEADKIKNSDFLIVLLNFEYQYPNWYNDIISKFTLEQFEIHIIENCKKIYKKLKTYTSCPILWFGYENENFKRTNICGSSIEITNIIDIVNVRVYELLCKNDLQIDTRHLIASIGISNAYNNKNKYRWNAPYDQQMIKVISDEIYKQYLIQNGITKKCLVLDCDGVLWGGILSEDGIEKIKLGNEGTGRSYQDFQRFLLMLYYHGVILSICSKNDINDVLQVFSEHSGMILKKENIACFQVNWNNKTENIRQIATILNLGFDSIVFVDDSKFEVESVHTLLPDVLAILYNRDTIYDLLSCFNMKSDLNSLDQIINRNLTYQTNQQRERIRLENTNFDSYLEALNNKVDIHKALPNECARIAELTQRTNQCTNGIRYTTVEILAHFENPLYQLYSVYVSDKFSDLGLVGVIGIDDTTLDLFSLSCRALGRNVEEKMIKMIIDKKVTDYTFISTGKNEALRNLLCFYIMK